MADNTTKNTEPRYIVSVGQFANESSAINRAQACTKSGFRADIIDKSDEVTTNTIAALMLIAETLNRLTVTVDQLKATVEKLRDAKPEQKPVIVEEKQQTVTDVLRKYKTKRGYTLEKVEELTKIPRGTLSNWFSGETKKVPAKGLLLVKDALKIPNDEIINFF